MTKSTKCANCKKRVYPIDFKCKCEKIFCIKCLPPDLHDCRFDHVSAGKRKLEEDNPEVVAPKMQKL